MSDTALVTGSATVVIERPPIEVYAAISDITRMGEWSPENTGGRWLHGAKGPAEGARFEGDNIVRLGPMTLKRWTTTSEVSECRPGECFEFVTENHTTWRFDLEPEEASTRVTQTYRHPPYQGWQNLVYEKLGRRSTAMPAGMQQTLDRLKAVLEP